MNRKELLSGTVGNALASAMRLGVLFALGRLIAEKLGGNGILALAQWQNLLAIGIGIGGNALMSGFQQGMARRHGSRAWFTAGALWGQALSLVGAGVVLVLCFGGILHPPAGIGGAFLWWLLPATMIGSFTIALQGTAAGLGRMGRLSSWTSISGLLLFLCIAPGLGSLHGLACGVLIAVPIQAVSAFLLLPRPHLNFSHLRTYGRAWAPWIAAGALPALLSPLLQLFLRQMAIAHDVTEAGYWQASVRLTDTLFPLWTGAVTAWTLPKLARTPSAAVLRRSLFRSFGGAAALTLLILAAAAPGLELAYGSGFRAAAPYLRLQASVELIRSLSLPFALLLMARGRIGVFLTLEVMSTLLQGGFAFLLLPRFGVSGLPLAALLENLIYALGTMACVKAVFRVR